MQANQTKLSVLIVDDEKKACTNLKNILIEYIDADIIIAGIANSASEAEEQIRLCNPDAVFLDIEMPYENAFDFLDRMKPLKFEVIFVTAYDEYAVKAFRLNAIDYILKPISINELKIAYQRLQNKLMFNNLLKAQENNYPDLSLQIKNKIKQYKLTLRDNNAVEIIDFKDLCYIEAQSSYSRIVYIKNKMVKEMVQSNPLSDYEEILPETMFYRIHRSYLINCAQIKKILNSEAGQVLMNDEKHLPVSRRRYPLLIDFLKNNDF